ncbi:MAG TPA: hypothetical protein VMW66_01600 [Elusimicrobiales bacterium]|nr:hypothetical protein [Elusimicrobiales bacterium]
MYAKFLDVNFKKQGRKCQIFVNANLRPKKGRSFRPDIVVVDSKKGKITKLVELKTDIGYSRKEFGQYLKNRKIHLKNLEKDKQIKHLSGNTCSNHNSDGCTISQNIKYDIVIISAQNAGEKDLTLENKKKRKAGIKVFCLSSERHPNIFPELGSIPDNSTKKYISTDRDINKNRDKKDRAIIVHKEIEKELIKL